MWSLVRWTMKVSSGSEGVVRMGRGSEERREGTGEGAASLAFSVGVRDGRRSNDKSRRVSF